MTSEDINTMKIIAKEIVSQTVRETLFQIGIIVEDTDDVVEFRRDMQHLRKWRMAVEAMENKSMMTAIGVLVTGAIAAIIMYIQAAFTGHY